MMNRKMIKQAQQLQRRMTELQEELDELRRKKDGSGSE